MLVFFDPMSSLTTEPDTTRSSEICAQCKNSFISDVIDSTDKDDEILIDSNGPPLSALNCGHVVHTSCCPSLHMNCPNCETPIKAPFPLPLFLNVNAVRDMSTQLEKLEKDNEELKSRLVRSQNALVETMRSYNSVHNLRAQISEMDTRHKMEKKKMTHRIEDLIARLEKKDREMEQLRAELRGKQELEKAYNERVGLKRLHVSSPKIPREDGVDAPTIVVEDLISALKAINAEKAGESSSSEELFHSSKDTSQSEETLSSRDGRGSSIGAEDGIESVSLHDVLGALAKISLSEHQNRSPGSDKAKNHDESRKSPKKPRMSP